MNRTLKAKANTDQASGHNYSNSYVDPETIAKIRKAKVSNAKRASITYQNPDLIPLPRQRSKKRESRISGNTCCSVLVHCYDSFAKLPQKTDQEISVLQCESEGSSFISVAKVDRRFEPKQKRERQRECDFDCNESGSSSDGSCLVANESIRLSDNSPAHRRINKPTSFLNSYKRRIVDRGTCNLKGRASCIEKVTLNSSPTALFSNNSPV